jgi:DNA primase
MTIREFISQIAQLRVAKSHGDEILVYCPWHDDQNASLAINPVKGMFHCFSGCVKGSGGLLSLFEKLDETGVVANKYLTMFAADISNFMPVLDFNHDAEIESDTGYDVMSLPLALQNEYLEGRGITEETVRRFDLRYHSSDDCIVIPIEMRGKSIGYIRRNISSNPKYLNSNSLPRDLLIYPFDLFQHKESTVFVCEGPFDAIKAHQLGLRNTVCTLGGVISDNQCRLLGELGSHIILVVDKDDSGIRITETNTKNLVGKYGFAVDYTTAPGQAKDFGEATDLSDLKIVSPYQLKAINRDLNYIIRS